MPFQHVRLQRETCSSPVRNAFICSAKCVHLQRQNCSSLDQDKTCSSLVINAFVCIVISYSEVNSRGYLVTGDKCACLQCDIKNPTPLWNDAGWQVSSRGYLVASNDAFICSVISYSEMKRVVFENWFRNLPKKNRN